MPHLTLLIRKWDNIADKWNKIIKDHRNDIREGSTKRVYDFVKFANLAGQYLRRAKEL
jgi:hypothetical protein